MPSPSLHPLNRAFHWAPPRGPYRRLRPEQARGYDSDGFFLLEDAFDSETLRELQSAIDPVEAEVEKFLATREDGKFFIARSGEITFTTHMVTRSERCREFCAGPVFRDLVHDLVGPDVRLYWDQAVYKKPGTQDEFPWHQDNGYTFVEPQQYLTCWVALTDTDEKNGCPWVVPGIHRRGTLEHWMTDLGWCCLEEPEGAVPVPARAGSIVVFSSLTPHRTGPNLSDDVRKSYIVQFAPDGARLRKPDDGSYEICDAPERQFRVLENGAPPEASS
ncbi:MAG: phytanoyl-CoA dioxygenase family protein [Myxococcota bacterium]|nr:phytanoyl-CoA dioxygenase family protein [Myxococcota bacterium]